jgi:hypothetical protein
MLVRWFPQRAAVGYSRWTDRSVHLCSKTPHACFHARGSSVRCPLAKALIQCTTSPGELVICGLAPPPSGASLPRADARVLALLQRDSLRSPPPHRPHVSISEVLPSALASCGILSDTPSGWHLLTSYESACRLPPFPIAIARIRRAVLSTGFLWQCRPVSAYGCRRPILCRFGSSASASCAG